MEAAVGAVNLRYVSGDVDRHGNARFYFRKQGQPKIRLPGMPGAPEFMDAYRAALAGLRQVEPPRPGAKPPAGSLRALCARYFASADFARLDARTQKVRRGILESICREPTVAGGSKPVGDLPALMPASKVRVIRDRKGGLVGAANNRVKALRQLYKFAVENEIVDRNPARDVAYLVPEGDGFHAWTLEEVLAFEARHPVGTRARLALALLLYTGQRRSDIVALGRQHVRDGWLTFTQFKGRKKKEPVTLSLPVLPELQRIIDATPRPAGSAALAFLVTEYGKPFTSNGFGNWFRARCDEAGLPQCSAHGLRKAAAARLAELGSSDREIMAVTGHKTSKEVDRYAKSARQKVLAKSAMDRLAAAQTGNEVSHSEPAMVASGTKSAFK